MSESKKSSNFFKDMLMRMQALPGRTLWDQEKARDIRRDYVIEHRGDPSGVLVLDETGFLKKGSPS